MVTHEIPDAAEQGVRELAGGIVEDFQRLLTQQLSLFKIELRDDALRARKAAIVLVLGLAFASLGFILLGLMLVFLLSASFPIMLWACFGIVGGIAAFIGGVLTGLGVKRVTAANLLPVQSARAFKENMQCLTNPR